MCPVLSNMLTDHEPRRLPRSAPVLGRSSSHAHDRARPFESLSQAQRRCARGRAHPLRHRFIGSFDLQRMDAHRDHEPRRSAGFSPQERSRLRTADDSQALGTSGWSCGINPALRFMENLFGSLTTHWDHGPCSGRRKEADFHARSFSTSSRRRLRGRFMENTRESEAGLRRWTPLAFAICPQRTSE
jgi:hypothetical protein